jgi:competence protein ComEC
MFPHANRTIFGFLLATSLFFVAAESTRSNAASATRWTMINVCPGDAQADCHLIELPDGSRVLIDIADASDAPGTALAYLVRHQIHHIDLVVISHFHKDHYGRLRDIIDAGIRVDRVAVNVPDKRTALKESSWIAQGGCDWQDVQATLYYLQQKKITVYHAKAGDKIVDFSADGVLVQLQVLCAYDGFSAPVSEGDVNDTSIILRLTHGSTRVLFTGDLNRKLGEFLAGSGIDLSADLIKVPHHGAESVAPNEFFDRVNAKTALVPAPKSLWSSPRSQRIRDYFHYKNIPVYVSGIDGDVSVLLDASGYSIKTYHSSEKK